MSKNLFPQDEMFINCFYTFGNKAEERPDSIIIVSKDMNGEKHLTYIEKPEFSFYVTKDIVKQDGKYLDYIPLDECKKVTCRYNNKYYHMAKATTNKEAKNYYKRCIDDKHYKKLREMDYLFPEFHSSDVNIEDYYIKEFLNQNNYEKCNFGIDISVFDIECDIADYDGFPDENIAPCPVNMITLFNMKTNTLYLFFQKYDTETFEEFRVKNGKRTIKEIREEYQKHFGDFKIILDACDDEFTLIKDFFDRINEDKSDYVLAWNSRFDYLTLYNRLKWLLAGSNIFPEDIMCPKDFPIKDVYFKLDESPESQNDFSSRFDTFKIYGWSIWMDMMCLYANITRPNGKKDSYSLDAIGEEETGMTKEDLSEDGTNIKTACYDNYTKFFKYSAVDSLLLALIVKKTGFVELLHMIVMMTRTRPIKALKKTVCLRNFAEFFYNMNGYSISNNHSYLTPQNEGIAGAFVAKYDLVEKISEINGIPTNKIFELLIDMDLTALYPSITQAYNISPSTLKYKIKYEDYSSIKTDGGGTISGMFNLTDSFMEKYISDDVITYCNKYHNLPDVEEMYKLLSERL